MHWQFFLIMFIKESPERARKRDRQGNAFFIVLLLSIVNVIIDIVSSLAMNQSTEWWMYEYAMTLYVASMPLLAAVWVCYEYVLIHRAAPQRVILRGIVAITLPYIIYALLAITNPHTEWFFHLTSDMQYSRGALFMPIGVGLSCFTPPRVSCRRWGTGSASPRARTRCCASSFCHHSRVHLDPACQPRLARHQRELCARVCLV